MVGNRHSENRISVTASVGLQTCWLAAGIALINPRMAASSVDLADRRVVRVDPRRIVAGPVEAICGNGEEIVVLRSLMALLPVWGWSSA
jgi:hypothetical protein